MTTIFIQRIKCDGCEKEIELAAASGWWTVSEVVADPTYYANMMRKMQETGASPAISGEFCSLPCLAAWAQNAGTLKELEEGL